MRTRDIYREWSYSDRVKAGEKARETGDWSDCDKYDRDRDSGDRAYRNWRSGGAFQDPHPDERFS